jgi:integrase
VRVYSNGRKIFTVRYTLHGDQRRKDVGVYRNERGGVGGEIGYSEARAEAERIISEARHGRDPFIGATLLRSADISAFEGLCERFLADPAPGRKGRILSEVTRTGITRIIRKQLIPAWGHRDPNSIQRPEIQYWAKAIADGKGRKKAAPYLANRAVDYMAMIYSRAVRREILRYTPFLGLEKPFAEQPRTRSFSNDELRLLVAALTRAPKQIAAVWLMLFYTANRLRETLKMQWAWIDFEKKYLVLPADVTKNKRPHLTNMAELGVAPHVADMVLNHAVKGAPRSRAHYDMYHYIPEKRDALTRWVQRFIEILGHDPNDVMKTERTGYQGRGEARKLGKRESYRERKARLAAHGRDLAVERRQRRQEAVRARLAVAS